MLTYLDAVEVMWTLLKRGITRDIIMQQKFVLC